MSACSVDGCEQVRHARSWCQTHYVRWKRTGSVHLAAREARTCRACDRPHYCQGLCVKHYQRQRAHGSLDDPPTFEDRFLSLIDKTDTCWLWTGSVGLNNYGRISRHNVEVYAHRVSYELAVGPISDDMTIDHLCRVTTCVNPSHLEPVSRSENTLRQWSARRAAA